MDTQEINQACKYLREDVVSGIKHEICENPKMRELNHSKDDETLTCMGKNCNCAEYNEA